MKKAEQGTQAIRTGGRSVPPLSGPLFLVSVDGLGNMPSNRRAVPRQSGKTLPDRLLCAVICGDIHTIGLKRASDGLFPDAGERNRHNQYTKEDHMSIDINSLTIGQAKELAALFGSAQQQQSSLNSLVGKKCVVRTYSAGVWFGEIVEKSGNEVIVKNARRMWQWWAAEGISLSAVALHGIKHDKSRVAEAVPAVWLEAIELITASDKAVSSIEGAPNARAE